MNYSLLRTHRTRRGGFTLVELLIVGTLISIFAGLAIFGVQQQFESNIRKATIGESRQIGTALDFANLDTSIFPQLCWLSEGQQGMQLLSVQTGVNLFGEVDVYGRASTDTRVQLNNQWDGPYFAISQTRAGIAQGRGGFIYMLFPQLPSAGNDNPNSPNTTNGYRWPADYYNNPYTVYMLDVDLTTGNPVLRFANQTAPADPTKKGNFVNAVVSYGRNRIPGGQDGERVTWTGADTESAAGPGAYSLRLYKGKIDFIGGKGRITHTALEINEYTVDRANVWSQEYFPNVGNTAALPSVGIADPGSDDVIFEF